MKSAKDLPTKIFRSLNTDQFWISSPSSCLMTRRRIDIRQYLGIFPDMALDQDQLLDQFKALADPARLAICQLLPESCECERVYNVSELAAEIGLSQPTVSHHLTILKKAGLVQCKKMCRDVYYWLDHDAARAVTTQLLHVLKVQQDQGETPS